MTTDDTLELVVMEGQWEPKLSQTPTDAPSPFELESVIEGSEFSRPDTFKPYKYQL